MSAEHVPYRITVEITGWSADCRPDHDMLKMAAEQMQSFLASCMRDMGRPVIRVMLLESGFNGEGWK